MSGVFRHYSLFVIFALIIALYFITQFSEILIGVVLLAAPIILLVTVSFGLKTLGGSKHVGRK